MIIPIVIGAVSIVFLLSAVYIKKHTHLPNDSPTVVGEIIGKDVVEGGSTRYVITFTDKDGIEHTASSQQISSSSDDKYKIGDSVPISYTLKKTLGIEGVLVRVEDNDLTRSSDYMCRGFLVVGILCAIICILSFAKVLL
ncbi:MAG: hypothetical protein ACI4G1_00975 [Ruminococcus sp.]